VFDLSAGAPVSITLRDLKVTGGRAQNDGGTHGPGAGIAVFAVGGSVLLERVWITGNVLPSGVSAFGAGIDVGSGAVEIRDSLVSGNVAEPGNHGGGVMASGGQVTLTNTTVTGNSAPSGGGAASFAGSARLHLRNATIARNGGGNLRRNAGGTGTAVNTIVADPLSGSNCDLAGSTWTTSTGNVSSSADAAADGCAFGSASVSGVNAGLGDLADNGGATQTMALLPGGAAIDAGSPDASLCPATDQRGQSRPTDGNGDGAAACDAGAFEAAAVQPPPPPPPPGGGNPGGGPPTIETSDTNDVLAPLLTVRGASRQAPLRRRNSVVFKATSNEDATLVVRGSFKVPGDRRTYRFESVTRVVKAARTVTLKLLIPRRGLSGVKRTLRRGRRINATFTLLATDTAGNSRTVTRRVKLAAR
jgi:hypothetical protein